ncbi:MAG: putative DNA binding domain-containing protein, partial [Bacteroidales bacterium]|nr:putative DNA binding domain-containing protein [Bacteroidales bacterium]
MNIGIENEELEFKKSTGELKEGVESICAMLNKHGRGTLYFGVKPDGTAVGQTVTDATLRDVSRKIREGIEPSVYPIVEKVVFGGKDCIKVEFEGADTPYFAFGIPRIRVADEDLSMSPRELTNFIRKKAIEEEGWENQISSKKVSDVDEVLVRRFIDRGKDTGRIPFEFTDVATVLNKLELTSGNNLLNAGSAIFCGGILQDLQMAVFATSERVTFLDMQRKSGPILTLVDEAVSYVSSKINWRVEITGSPQRNEIPEVPLDAVRELILNSWCHKDYTSATSNEIAIHPDRIEIFNPGRFPDGYTPHDFATGKERPIRRNPLITRTLYLTKEIESFATGLKRVIDTCDAAGVKYEFKQLKSGFVSILYRDEITEKITEKTTEKNTDKTTDKTANITEKILALIKSKSNITAKEIAEMLDITIDRVDYYIRKLKKDGA